MYRFIITFFSLLLFFGCSENKEKRPQITSQQQAEIEVLANKLITSINEFDFSVINTYWNNDAFKARISKISKTQQSVFEHIFEESLRLKIKSGNLAIIHVVNSDNGNISKLALNHFEKHSELILLLTFQERYNFFKYRIEVVDDKLVICDFYHFKDNLWFSEKMVNMLRLNSKYKAYSKERTQANRAISSYEKALNYGDTLEALYSLYDVPETHQFGNGLSMMKLNVAAYLSDTLYEDVLVTEYENNKSLYMQYLHTLHFDTANLEVVYKLLSNELGESEALDTLTKSKRFWN